MAFTHALATNNYGPAKLIVATSAANGTHTTLATAMADASVGDTIFLRDSVTENVTITPGVNIAAWQGGSANTPAIIGTFTMTAAGTSTISGIRLQTNSAALLAVTGSAASIVNLNNCYLNCTNNTGITFSSSNASAQINITNCSGDLGTTGIGIFSHSSSGSMTLDHLMFTNSGGSTAVNTCSAGILNATFYNINNPITFSGTSAGTFEHGLVVGTNTTALTLGGSGIQIFKWSRFASGSASAVSISTTATLEFCEINSTNTNAITGAGTLNLGIITFSNSSSTINTSTVTSLVSQGGSLNLNTALTVANGGTGRATLTNHGVLVGAATGAITQLSVGATNSVLQGTTGADPAFTTTPTVTSITLGSGTALSTYVEGSWTPNLQINGSSTGITYSNQTGGYTQIGNTVVIWGTILLSSKGASTGSVTISNLPVSVSANGTLKNMAVGEYDQLTAAGYTSLGLRLNNSAVANLIKSSASGSAVANVSNSDISNTFQFRFSGVYITN